MASWGRGQYLIYSWGNKKKHRIETIFLGLPLALAVVTLQQRESQSRERWPAQRRGMSTASYSSHFSDPSNNAGLMASHPSHQTWKTIWETAICPRGWGWSSTTCGRGRKWRWDNEDIGEDARVLTYAIKNQWKARNAPSRGLWVPWAGSLWHKRAGVATLGATHFVTIWNI